MKNKLFSLLLSLILLISMIPSAVGATLDTADLQIQENSVTIGSDNDAVLKALDSQGRTAKIAVPYTQAEVYVVKDNATIVPHNWDKPGYIQFAVPGSGTYVIIAGTPQTMEEQLEENQENVILTSDDNSLTNDHSVEDGTVIHANNKTIHGIGTGKTLTAEGNLQIKKINGLDDIQLDVGDKITFDAEGNAKVVPNVDESVGYGRFCITRIINGKAVTQTCFLVKGEELVITKAGRIPGNSVFAMGEADAKLPPYEMQFDDHDNTHVRGESEILVARCNGLFDYYTKVTLTSAGSSEVQKLAEKTGGEDITVSGVTISSGSTVLTLKSTYLNTLDTGTYTLTFHYADGGQISKPLQITKQAGTPDHTNPKTGDFIGYAFVMLATSATLLVTMWIYERNHIFECN